jgi:hypothetical protein
MRVIAVATTHDPSELNGANAFAESVGALQVRVGGERPSPRLEITVGVASLPK